MSARFLAAAVVPLAGNSPVAGGLHVSAVPVRELPADWRGYLPDHRALRQAAAPDPRPDRPSSPLRGTLTDAALKLEAAARTRSLTADETADLGGLYVRLGRPDRAVELLRPAARRHPDHFPTAANLGTAWQLVGDLDQSAAALEDAVRLAPEPLRPVEAAHLKLVRLRQREGSRPADAVDHLFGPTPPADAAATLQRLALWLPSDGRLLWQLGELAAAAGDIRTAANVLDGCVTELGMKSPAVRERRQRLRAEADELAKRDDHRQHRGTLAFRSPRPLVRLFDPARLPPVNPDGVNPLPWPALTETEVGRGFKPSFLKHVAALDGRRVSVAGHMVPTTGGESDPAGFLLTEYPVGCWFCESPGPTQLLNVELAAGSTAEPSRAAVKVTGTLRLNRTDPERHLFTLTDAAVGPVD